MDLTGFDPSVMAQDTYGGRLRHVPGQRYASNEHEEPSDMALSDNELTYQARSSDFVLPHKPSDEPRSSSSSDEEMEDVTPAKSKSKPKKDTPKAKKSKAGRPKKDKEENEDPGFTAEETRFLICMRAYLAQSLPVVTKAFNAAFFSQRKAKDIRWARATKIRIAEALKESQGEERFKAYWESMEGARKRMGAPEGLSERRLEEARRWVGRMRRD